MKGEKLSRAILKFCISSVFGSNDGFKSYKSVLFLQWEFFTPLPSEKSHNNLIPRMIIFFNKWSIEPLSSRRGAELLDCKKENFDGGEVKQLFQQNHLASFRK